MARATDNGVMHSNPIVRKALNSRRHDIIGRAAQHLNGQNEPCSQSMVGVPRTATAITTEAAILITLIRRVLTPVQS
ncbi:MAG: hypothetical protein BGP09_28125 [Rhizobium sp. 60-20]|nr:MAG: hypothetical protein BGP09_28125 [Rhizobium sp. 60-20]